MRLTQLQCSFIYHYLFINHTLYGNQKECKSSEMQMRQVCLCFERNKFIKETLSVLCIQVEHVVYKFEQKLHLATYQTPTSIAKPNISMKKTALPVKKSLHLKENPSNYTHFLRDFLITPIPHNPESLHIRQTSHEYAKTQRAREVLCVPPHQLESQISPCTREPYLFFFSRAHSN